MRPIDADALMQKLSKLADGNDDPYMFIEGAFHFIRNAPTVNPWHRVEEPPKHACDCFVCWTTIHDEETGEVTGHGFWCEKGWYEDGLLGEVGFYCQRREETHPVRVEPDYWMPLPEPPKEDQQDDYDPCYECGGYGDDYSFDEDGELVSNCPDCPFN